MRTKENICQEVRDNWDSFEFWRIITTEIKILGSGQANTVQYIQGCCVLINASLRISEQNKNKFDLEVGISNLSATSN